MSRPGRAPGFAGIAAGVGGAVPVPVAVVAEVPVPVSGTVPVAIAVSGRGARFAGGLRPVRPTAWWGRARRGSRSSGHRPPAHTRFSPLTAGRRVPSGPGTGRRCRRPSPRRVAVVLSDARAAPGRRAAIGCGSLRGCRLSSSLTSVGDCDDVGSASARRGLPRRRRGGSRRASGIRRGRRGLPGGVCGRTRRRAGWRHMCGRDDGALHVRSSPGLVLPRSREFGSEPTVPGGSAGECGDLCAGSAAFFGLPQRWSPGALHRSSGSRMRYPRPGRCHPKRGTALGGIFGGERASTPELR